MNLKAIATTNTVRAFMTANFKSTTWSCDCSCTESMFYVLQNVSIVDTILYGLLMAMISHTSYRFEFGGHKKHIPIIGCCSGCKSGQ